MTRILAVDDEPAVRFTLAEALADLADEVVTAESGEAALPLLDAVDVVVTDLAMPGLDGLGVLAAARRADPDLPVVLVTAHGSERVAIQAVRAGAFDYLRKPWDLDELRVVVGRALETRRLRTASRRAEAERVLGRPILGDAPSLRRVLSQAVRIGDRDLPVLVTGETGTGKELVAALVHASGRRRSGPLVRFNAAALPETLAESELFGHERGAFTGADRARRGYFAEAHGGTLVLDEIGDLSLAVQAKLLRAVQDGEIQPLGRARPERVDVRVIACTHRDLCAEVRAGRFREDLYYRLAVVELRVPPLRERPSDVPLLATAFAARYAERFGLEGVWLTPELLAALTTRTWPGNVRELEGAVARIVALSDGGAIDVDALVPDEDAAKSASQRAPGATEGRSYREQVDSFERELLREAVAASNGNQSEAARRLGMSRVTMIDRLKKLGLK